MNRFLNWTILFLFLTLILNACIPSMATTSVSATSTPRSNRFGTTKIEAVGSSGVEGTFVAQDNDDGTTTVSIQLSNADHFNPWGIYATGNCQNGVPENTRPVFSLPDIEAGKKVETVETAAYQSISGFLIIIVYGITPDNTQRVVACGSLGPPIVTNTGLVASATPGCTSLDAGIAPTPSTDVWLAFSASQNNNSDIYLLNMDATLRHTGNGTIKRLTTDPATDFDPTWSPDGAHLAFRSQRDGNDEIYVMNADGTCQTNLTKSLEGDWSPAWSPDGKRIAFARFFDSNAFTDIAVMNADGSGLQRLTTYGGEYPVWSPDGTRIAFGSARDGNYEIYVMNAAGTNQIRLTDHPAYDMSPSWSSDDKHIVFDTQRDSYPPTEDGIGPEFEIHRIAIDGSEDIRLTKNEDEDRFPTWGPNGWIAFSRNGSLFVMKTDGSDQMQLAESGTFPAWWSVR
jgi:Tol biopolymer transport system component